MGGKCCAVEVPNARRESIMAGIAASELGGIKSGKEFKEQYKEQGSGNLFVVQARDSVLQYSCRKLPKSKAPCTNARTLEEHFIKLNALEHPHVCKFVEVFRGC